ncbi:hypothetical protein EG329_013746 [Mollisiaceae sp. DMI_Dod_QoI]|nr:hypothetical protein EG329_013746 [Helotiales sp. DMI_Dod_QoI]
MTSLTELPGELLLHIVSYLEPDPPALTSRPFPWWPIYLGTHLDIAHQRNKNIKSLAHTCKHLYDILFPAIHSQIRLRGATNSGKLYDAIESNGRLGQSIVTAHLNGGFTFDSFCFIFFLPNISTIYLKDWSEWELENEPDASLRGASPVTSLYLINCGALEEPLKELFSWPKALKELWFQTEQVEWEGHSEDQDASGFTCSAVSRALAPLSRTLEKLVLTRKDPDHEGLFYSDAIDLSGFGKLKELITFHVLLVGYAAGEGIRRNLPRSLESLEVWYDDAGFVNFFQEERPNWLFGILEHKKESLLELGRVRVVSLEWWDEEEDGEAEARQDQNDGLESCPPELKKAFEDARVSYSIYLNEKRRSKQVVDGGQRLDEVWDEEEIKHPLRD